MKVYVDDNEDYRITYSSRDGSECLESMGMQPIIVESLSDYTKQVRKEVCEEIKKWCDKNFNWVGDGTGYDGQDYNEMIGSNNTINKLRKLLDQIQGKRNERIV